MCMLLSRSQKYFFLYFFNPSNVFYLTKIVFLNFLQIIIIFLCTNIVQLMKLKLTHLRYIYIYMYILFDLTSYEVWWAKLDKCEFFFTFFQVYPFIVTNFNSKIRNKWWHSQSALSCEEIGTLFDQIEQKST